MSPGPFAVQLPRLTPEELNQRYEEWMKIAADNKINANNTWDFALIDYFYDMSLLRDGDSINFQKASCTLDGCVKIYSSRVDSVASETGRLLSGLAEAPGKHGSSRRPGEEDEDGEGTSEGGGRQRSRRANRSANTLAKDLASISVKKLDLEFSVDPLFKKTSADFDEGGARGLLLNHLCLDADGKIVFDASDAKPLIDKEGDEQIDEDEALLHSHGAEDGGAEDSTELPELPEQSHKKVAVAKLHKPSLIDISSMEGLFDEVTRYLDDAHICPSLSDFEFTCDTSLDFSLLKEHLREGAEDALDDATAITGPHGSMDGDGADALDSLSDFGGGGDADDMDHFLNFDSEDAGPVPIETASALQVAETEEAEDQGDMLAAPGASQLAMDGDEDSMLSYFDTKLVKGWAGPEHWRLPISRAIMRQQQPGEDETNNAEEADSKRKRSEKQAYFTDFINGDDVSAETLFVKPARASAITMTKKAIMNQEHTLPEDVHFSSKNLFNLLLKPKLKFNTRKARVSAAAGTGSGAGAEASASGTGGYGGFVVDGDDTANILGGAGDDGQFGGSDDRDGFDDVDDFDDEALPLGSGDAAADPSKSDVPQLKLIKPLYVNYARRAKRVNVKKLKDNIWKEMAIGDRRKSLALLAGTGKEPDELDPAAISADDDTIKLEGKQRFSEVVSSLKNVYPREKLEELSISYCFICLLHLANERSLRIVGDSSLRDLVITQDSFE
ncbi:barren [Martensiomyces pterosporus]|nr:barren [Martensiomyces pterosporus]